LALSGRAERDGLKGSHNTVRWPGHQWPFVKFIDYPFRLRVWRLLPLIARQYPVEACLSLLRRDVSQAQEGILPGVAVRR
jgi:hypothetical protein